MNGVVAAESLQRGVEQFLFREAACADRHDYDAWLALWDAEATYWVPSEDDDADPRRHVSIIYDNRVQLEDRVNRLKGLYAFSQQPQARLIRTVGNVSIDADDGTVLEVSSTFCLGERRAGHERTWFARVTHTLVRAGDGFRTRRKKVCLLNNDGPVPNLTFLI